MYLECVVDAKQSVKSGKRAADYLHFSIDTDFYTTDFLVTNRNITFSLFSNS